MPRRANRIKVGDLVAVRYGAREQVAEVVEDRGDLGVGGEQLLRVGWWPSGSSGRLEFEVPASDLRVLNKNEAAGIAAKGGPRRTVPT